MIPSKNIDYKLQRETSRQWRLVVTAMAQEFTNDAPYDSINDLGHRVGINYAVRAALPACTCLHDLEAAISSRWQSMDWGWIDLDDRGKNLLIVHHGAGNGQLAANAFGSGTPVWLAAFLGGVYQQWLASLGAGQDLRVKQISPIDEFGTIEFELSR